VQASSRADYPHGNALPVEGNVSLYPYPIIKRFATLYDKQTGPARDSPWLSGPDISFDRDAMRMVNPNGDAAGKPWSAFLGSDDEISGKLDTPGRVTSIDEPCPDGIVKKERINDAAARSQEDAACCCSGEDGA
jgi:hypothetical protein